MSIKIYVDCTRGIASDMLVGALLDCFDDKAQILHELEVKMRNNMLLTADSANSYERSGLLFKAKDKDYIPSCNTPHRHMHSTLGDVHEFINGTDFSDKVKDAAKGVYDIIAAAEAEVHGADVRSVHFHEVGQKRAIACIVSACALFDRFGADEVVFSHVNTGYGRTICAHGEVDVPAPATRIILKDVPQFFIKDMKGELCTPTGAALVKYFATSYATAEYPVGVGTGAVARGVGLGSKDIGAANGVVITVLNV